MNELAAILSAARRAWAANDTPVLATVVETRGSSYRKPGARMLVTRDGWQAGSISGGCLEADLVRKASWLVEHGTPTLKTYDTSVDGDVALGCGGEVDVFVEPFLAGSPFASGLEEVVERRRTASVELRLPDGRAWVHQLKPAPRLIIGGAGHDALPLHSMAQTLGWDVHVVDWRPSAVTAERFPGATVHCLSSERLDGLPLEAGCAVVVMSHHLIYDTRLVEACLRSGLPRYVGLLGPKKRAADVLEALPGRLPYERLHAPVGLALGGEGPAAVALSILAEVHASLHDAPAVPMAQHVRRVT